MQKEYKKLSNYELVGKLIEELKLPTEQAKIVKRFLYSNKSR